MKHTEILKEAMDSMSMLKTHYHYLHTHAELGFDLPSTYEYVKNELEKMGLYPRKCGRSGIVATIGTKKGKCFLLRADMDALPIEEESYVSFPSENGNMHACGHDMHTAMLLGAAAILKKHEAELGGTVKLMFQPAEETLEGAMDMMRDGVLENPPVDAAMMLHVLAGVPFQTGTAMISAPGISAPAADYFIIRVFGKGAHGSMPHLGVDPITVGAHILIALQEIHARELASTDVAVLTVGKFETTSSAANVIPESITMEGSLRAFDDNIRDFLKKRIKEIAEPIAEAFGARADVLFGKGCPALVNDETLSRDVTNFTTALLGKEKAFSTSDFPSMNEAGEKNMKGSGSEDFAYVSHAVPSVMIALAAGEISKGFPFPQHHPKVKFDENALPIGAAVYAWNALRWLESHQGITTAKNFHF